MKTIVTAAVLFAGLVLAPGAASAQAAAPETFALRSIRVSSPDPDATKAFYKAFFMGKEPYLVVVSKRAAGVGPDEVPHIMLNVNGLDSIYKRALSLGATPFSPPHVSALKNTVAMFKDPAGNVIELIGTGPGNQTINY